MDQTQNWSKEWKSSTNPTKQRKYRENAPQHVKDKLVSANLSHKLRDELGTRNIPLRRGDQVEVVRGDEKGEEGIISSIDRDSQKVYVNNITVTRNNGTESEIPLRPSNLQVKALNIDDNQRLEKYGVEDAESISVDEEEMEEALEEDEESEMMQQMQSGQSPAEIDEEELEEIEDEVEEQVEEEESEDTEESADADYDEVVVGTISDAKDQINDMENPDYEALLEAEKNNKNRTTLVEWLENKVNQ
jgi:large subunit ribosomal protein L24